MNDQRGEIVTVRAKALETFGRFLVSARYHHFVSDTRASADGPGEAIQAGELLLSSLASCGLGLIHKEARDRNEGLLAGRVEVSFERDPNDKTRYTAIRLAFELEGISLPQARSLLEAFTANCPIYNTLRRGGPIEATVAVRSA